MFRVVLEEVGSGVKPCDLTTPIVHIPLIMLVYSTSAWNFSQVYRQPRRHM